LERDGVYRRGDMNSSMPRKTSRERLLTLHHELLYPAFLGAALFEFAKQVFPDGTSKFFTTELFHDGITDAPVVWFLTALFFLLYFSVAFLALSDAEKKPNKFSGVSFVANLFEIGVILLVSISIATIDTSSHNISSINYTFIYTAWMLMPICGGVSNLFSGRTVHTMLSIGALIMGILGLAFVKTWSLGYYVLLLVMYFLLFVYYHNIFATNLLRFFEKWDLGPDSKFHKWAEQITGGRPSASH
jgi:hypothetical protein